MRKRDGTQEVSYRDASSKYQWTPVVGRRRKKTPLPDYVLRRLPPHCWQELLSGIPGVVVYIDDILIREKAEADHMAALEEVLKRMENTGVWLKRDKCVFLTPSVIYLGYQIGAQGIHPMAEKVKAIQDAPWQENITELKSYMYIGPLNYYSWFLPNLSTMLAPLYKLLKHIVQWRWTEQQENAFTESKKQLLSNKLLIPFSPTLRSNWYVMLWRTEMVQCLSHQMPDGSEKPVGLCSRHS